MQFCILVCGTRQTKLASYSFRVGGTTNLGGGARLTLPPASTLPQHCRGFSVVLWLVHGSHWSTPWRNNASPWRQAWVANDYQAITHCSRQGNMERNILFYFSAGVSPVYSIGFPPFAGAHHPCMHIWHLELCISRLLSVLALFRERVSEQLLRHSLYNKG